MFYVNYSELWEDCLKYIILKRTVKGLEKLETAAKEFHCDPADFASRECFYEDHHYQHIEYYGRIRFDEDQGWMICGDVRKEMEYWWPVSVSREETSGNREFLQELLAHPEIAENKNYRMILSVPALDEAMVWAREAETVGGETPTLSLITDDDTWRLVCFHEDLEPFVKRALLRDLFYMNPANISVIRRFLFNPLFSDAMISFLGFAAGRKLDPRELLCDYNIEDLTNQFNLHAIKMVCKTLSVHDTRNFIENLQDGVGENSVSSPFSGWLSFLVTMSVVKRSSFWCPGEAFIDALPLIPEPLSLPPVFVHWCTTYNEQTTIAWDILGRPAQTHHPRHVDVLIGLLCHSEPFHPYLVGSILNYLFNEKRELVFQSSQFLALLRSQNMLDPIGKTVLSMLKEKYE